MRSRLAAVPAAIITLLLLSGCATNAASSPSSAAPHATAAATASASDSPTASAQAGTCNYSEAAGAVREVTPPPAEPTHTGTVSATMTTSAGELHLTLDADKTACTTNSFISLSEQGYYNDTTCHRLTTAGIFVLQCGDPSGTGMGGPGYRYADELDGTETYPAGTVAMANAGANTNGSQFFLVYKDTELPASYTVFGTLDAASLEVLTAIAAKGTSDGGSDGAPAEPVTIEQVTIG